MATSYKETAKLGHNFKIDGKGPIDVRFVVGDKSSLTDGTFTYENSYNMLMVGVEADKGIYVLTNANAPTQLNSWQKLASASDLSGLSGVFTFKGVAETINQDQSILTIKQLKTQEITDEEGNVTTPSEPLHCVTTAYEFDMDVYYGWGTSLEDIKFWTDTTTVTNSTAQYDKGEQLSVTAYEFNNKLYYPTDTQQKYESIDGEVIYIKENQVYQTADSQTSLGNAKAVSYDGYDFKEKSSKLLLEADADSESISASSDNSGHVYQIGENEYASNGQIWVKLGSPVEDWIIL